MSSKQILDYDTPEMTNAGVEYNVQDDVIRLRELLGSAEEILTGSESNLYCIVNSAIMLGGAKELRTVLSRHKFITKKQDEAAGKKCAELEMRLHCTARTGLFVAEEGERKKNPRKL